MNGITRREFVSLSVAAAASAALPGNAWSQPRDGAAARGSKKRGLGISTANPAWPGVVTELRCRWFYTWGGSLPTDPPADTPFIPMVRSRHAQPERIAEVADQARSLGITDLLGLNEPDEAKQDNMSVEEALAIWPMLMETGLRLGSPGCVHPDNDWMTAFMAGVEKQKLRVDFVCVHSYGGPDARAFVRKLTRIHRLYDRPLWITEFAVGDWAAKSLRENKHSPGTVLDFMEEVLPMLEDLDCLERYAWFPARPDSAPLGTSALFDATGTLTPLGELYSEA